MPFKLEVDLEKLRQMTQEAKVKQAGKRTKKADLEKLAMELKVKHIIEQIPLRVKTEAMAGRNHAIVMSVGHGDYERPDDENDLFLCKPEWLKRVCKMVYQACVDAGLNPSLEYWMKEYTYSGFNIVVHW